MRTALVPALFGLTALADQLIKRDFPHLIIPLDSNAPDTAYNTQSSFRVAKGVGLPTFALIMCRH